MPTVEALMDATSEALETMFFSSILDQANATQADRLAIAYQLRFRGESDGDFALGISQESAVALAANFLGEDADAVAEQAVQDVVGELTNMVAGRVLSKLESRGTFALTHPMPGEVEELRQQVQCGEAHIFDLDDGVLALRMRM